MRLPFILGALLSLSQAETLYPRIYKLPKGDIIVNNGFDLKCILYLENEVTFTWFLPNENANDDTKSEDYSRVDHEQTSTLRIFNATKNDEGNYTCQVEADGANPVNTTEKIPINETLSPYINFEDHEDIKVNERKDMNWISKFKAQPSKPTLIYTNFAGEVIKESENVTITESFDEDSGQSELVIKNISASDFGNYTVTGFVENDNSTAKSLTVLIKVLSEPYIMNERTENLTDVEKGTKVDVSCAVMGYPLPDISWYYKNCSACYDEDLHEPKVVEDARLPPGNIRKQTISFEVENSVHLGCRFKDESGHVVKKSLRAEIHVSEGTEDGFNTELIVILTIFFVIVAFLVIAVASLIKRVKKERAFRKRFRDNALFLFENGNVGDLNKDCTADEQAELLPYDKSWEVSKDKIKLGKQLGAGAFGRVVKGIADLGDGELPTTVAVKMCKSQGDQEQVRALALELKIMIHLGQHLNIVNLMGASTVDIGKGELWILVEFCRFGNLLTFMHRHRKVFINQIDPVTDKMDLTKLFRDAGRPMSPSSCSIGTRADCSKPQSSDEHGNLAPKQTKYCLEPTPQVESPGSSSSTLDPIAVSSDIREMSHGYLMPQTHNRYSRNLMSEYPGDTKNKKNSERSQDQSAVTHGHSGYANMESAQYSRDPEVVVNTDMTVLFFSSQLSRTELSPSYEVGQDSHGSSFMHDIGSVPGMTAPFTTSDLILWAWQVAQGMDYLTYRKILHGDLAARNLLLTDDNVVKISDFGLSRDIYRKDVYMKKGDNLMPMKWMSVEAIRDRIFSVQSDIWAYGVTLWELFTLGSAPYPSLDIDKDFHKLLEGGYRMEKPKYGNHEVYDVILQCWEKEPTDRPSFSKIADQLELLLNPSLKGHYVSMNDPYLRMNEERFGSGTDYLTMMASPDFSHLNKTDDDHTVQTANLWITDEPEESNEPGESDYLTMKSPDLVRYSQRPSEAGVGAVKERYLPVISTQDSPRDIFSPKPNQALRFTFEGKDI